MPEVLIRLNSCLGASMPCQGSKLSAGYDLTAAEGLIISPKDYAKVKTGVFMAIPKGFEAQIRPRSGLAAKYGVTVLNAPGTIDADYRGEVCVLLINHGKNDFEVKPGMRIAQMVFARVEEVSLKQVKELSNTERSEGGFGSTGLMSKLCKQK